MYLGEIISIIVTLLWTVTALAADGASRRIGSLSVNILRMILSIFFLGILLWVSTGSPLPLYADRSTWLWLSLSGLVGYVFGDFCLFNCYVAVGSRIGQLFMTIAPIVAAVTGWLFLGETMSAKVVMAMFVTLSGIAICILTRRDGSQKLRLSIPLKGVLLGIGAGIGQGVGLVISKIGMIHYDACIPAEGVVEFNNVLPFASTFIRAVTGAAGFILLALLQGAGPKLRQGIRDGKAMSMVLLTTVLGPVLGVSLSLMAVRYTSTGIASTIMALVPVVIILPHALIYKQKVTAREIVGTMVSLSGVALFFL